MTCSKTGAKPLMLRPERSEASSAARSARGRVIRCSPTLIRVPLVRLIIVRCGRIRGLLRIGRGISCLLRWGIRSG